VPASGKTEVYLRLISKTAREGGQALFLLPEISLTKPFYDEFQAALGVPVALWHSQLTPAQRRKTWLALRRGDVKVVVGARSAAMLPFSDLRLIVLDEEHDESFKEEGRAPLYHARDVALHRGQAHGALVVLGTATPSLESWQAVKRGELELLAMPDRVSKLARPNVMTVPLPFGRCLSEELVSAVRERLKRKEQSILLVNRRGFSTLFMCGKCGWVMRCQDCGVAMIQHELTDGGSHLRCHHCEKTSAIPAGCPQGHGALRILGAGTQKVVSELKKFIPEARVLRMDSDTVLAEKKADKRAYDLFKAGEADVLVGTKLIAKSFHFPDVTLVGVVDADTMLHMPEFRSSERTMQLLAQVAGRSGRAEKPGEVLLQTLQPDHIAIAGASGDYAAFAEKELSSRRELGYPPFTTLIRLIWTDPVEEKCADKAQEACVGLRAELEPLGHEVVGPAPAVLPRAYGKFRWHALVKVSDGLEGIVARLRSLKDVKVNVDPYDLF
jgi:primosomal protein N' (replication factor Y)